MRRVSRLTVAGAATASLALALSAASPAIAVELPQGLVPGGAGRVVEVIDGDTVILEDGREVRLVGIQAPKLPLGRAGYPTWPLAPEAKTALERLALAQEVTLGFGIVFADQALGDLFRRQVRHGNLLMCSRTVCSARNRCFLTVPSFMLSTSAISSRSMSSTNRNKKTARCFWESLSLAAHIA